MRKKAKITAQKCKIHVASLKKLRKDQVFWWSAFFLVNVVVGIAAYNVEKIENVMDFVVGIYSSSVHFFLPHFCQ